MKTRNICVNFVKGLIQEASVHPRKHQLLLKFTEFKIKGKAKDRLLARAERAISDQVKEIFRRKLFTYANYTDRATAACRRS
jgi:hypothetical protein